MDKQQMKKRNVKQIKIKKLIEMIEHESGKKVYLKEDKRRAITSVEIKKGIDALLSISEPQNDCFIGAYDLAKNFNEWKEYILSQESNLDLRKVLHHFEKNVKAIVVSEQELLPHYGEDEEDENEYDEEYPFEVETPLPVSELKNLNFVSVPKGAKYFELLPVDYNRYGMDDIVVAFLTEEGKKYYGNHLTGDY